MKTVKAKFDFTSRNLFTVQPERPWKDYLKLVALALSTKIAQSSIWLLHEGLNTPFGLCVYTLCSTYGWYGTRNAVIFSSQMAAAYYVVVLASLSLILPVLMLLSIVRTFLYLQIGEEVIKERVGVWGIRPLIAAAVGPFFLFFLDSHTRERSGGPDLDHWGEVSAHALEVQEKNISHLKYELNQINAEHKSLLEKKGRAL